MEPYAQYHQPSAYPHSQHPNQASPVMQTQQPPYGQHQTPQQLAHPQLMTQMPYNAAYAMQQPYGVSPSHAAAMATAAASGYHPPPYTMPDSMGSLHQTSPRLQGVKTDAALQRTTDQSPRSGMGAPVTLPGQINLPSAQNMGTAMPQPMQQLPQRRMSHASPAVQNPQQSQAGMNAPPRPGGPAQQAGAPQAAQPHQSPEVGGGGQVEESPLYVNAKQFHRILKRRMARQKLEEQLRLTNKGRKPYLHESRHNHAMRRPRGPGGRFLTADEVSQMEARAGGGGDAEMNGNGNATSAPNGSGKRKREGRDDAKSETPTKKIKSDEEDEDEEEDQDDEG